MAKSRYGPLVKLKKKELDEAERDVVAANNQVAAASTKLENAYETLRQLSLPTQGSIQELSQANMMIQMQHFAIEQCKEALESAISKQRRMREAFNKAMADFDKFNYLEVEEHKVRLQKLKDQEAKMMDEIGTIMYKREKK